MVRVKQRYILFNILYPAAPATSTVKGSDSTSPTLTFHQPSPANLNRVTLGAIIRNSISHNFGDWGIGQAGSFAVKYFSPATSTGILRITRDNYRLLWAALTYIRELYGQPVVIKVVRVSGTIRKAEVEAIKLAEETIRKVKLEQKASRSGKGVAALFTNTGSKEGKKQDLAELEDIDMDVNIIDSDDEGDDEVEE
ncbi:hypothetical protein ABW19_dt0207352 [Dactylella cylindrospora]|nr:hypothetical protein ABW19_dt0207352 [Dactylella cylindrospora]